MNQLRCEACHGLGQIVDNMDVDGSTFDCPVCDGLGYYLDDADTFDENMEAMHL